jgi:mono/diheme cytochrome c family protein
LSPVKGGFAAAALALAAGACARQPAAVSAGRALFAQRGCAACHRAGGQEGGETGPDLTYVGARRRPAWLEAWLRDPAALHPGALMPKPSLSEAERASVTAYLASLRGQDYRRGTPPWDRGGLAARPRERGGELFKRLGCVGCHGSDAGGGGPPHDLRDKAKRAPALRGLAARYSRASLRALLLKPPKAPDSMPSLSSTLTPGELDSMIEHLLSL